MSDSDNVNEKPTQLDVMDSEERVKDSKYEEKIVDENEESLSSAAECDDPLSTDSNTRANIKKELERELARRCRERHREKINQSKRENQQIKKNISSVRCYEARKERDQRYRERHRDEINLRRRENRRSKKDRAQSASDVPVDAEDRERRKKELHRQRQQRYYEKHREEISQRQKEYRTLISIAQQDASAGASVIDDGEIQRKERLKERLKERQRRYRVKNQEKINHRQKKYRQLLSYVQQSANAQSLDTQNNDKVQKGRKKSKKNIIDGAAK